jgi:hypothetical protein
LNGAGPNENSAKSGENAKNAQSSSPLISDYKEYHTDCTVRFLVKMTKSQYQNAMEQHGSLHKFFKIQKSIALTNMVLFDSKGIAFFFSNLFYFNAEVKTLFENT